MNKRTLAISLALAMLTAGAATQGNYAQAEIKSVAAVQGAANAAGEPLRLMAGEPMRLQCWQEGVQIIDEATVEGLSFRALQEQDSFSFGAGSARGAGVVVLSLQDSTCLVRRAR